MRRPRLRRDPDRPTDLQQMLHDREVGEARTATAEAAEAERRAGELEQRLAAAARMTAARRRVRLAVPVLRAN